MHAYISEKYDVYILNIFIYNIKYIHINIFKYILYVCVFIYTVHIHILCKQTYFGCD